MTEFGGESYTKILCLSSEIPRHTSVVEGEAQIFVIMTNEERESFVYCETVDEESMD